MLECTRPWGAPVPSYRPSAFVVGEALERWQLAAYWRLRTRVFVEELRLFHGDDIDEHDACAIPIVVSSVIAGIPEDVVGAVRIYRTAPLTWYGGRLAVDPPHRRNGRIGAALIGAAVGMACRLGCSTFLATVHAQNARYFERRRFTRLQEVSVCGAPHVLMQADLTAFVLPDDRFGQGHAARF